MPYPQLATPHLPTRVDVGVTIAWVGISACRIKEYGVDDGRVGATDVVRDLFDSVYLKIGVLGYQG